MLLLVGIFIMVMRNLYQDDIFYKILIITNSPLLWNQLRLKYKTSKHCLANNYEL